MAGEAQEWRDLAAELFSGAGDVAFSATISRQTNGAGYNPETGEITEAITSSACLVIFDENKGQSSRYFSGAQVLPDGAPAYIQGASFIPKKGDEITISGRQTAAVLFADDITGIGAVSFCILEVS